MESTHSRAFVGRGKEAVIKRVPEAVPGTGIEKVKPVAGSPP
jgi:hypothetical protein